MGAPERFLAAGLLLAALACGGMVGPPAATSLVYADPGDTTQWRLVQAPSSTPTHLVLDLLAPAGTSGMGVTLVLQVDGTLASWGQAGGAGLVLPGSYAGPLAQKASLQGATLRILLSQENPTPPIAYADAPVLTVALDLAGGVQPGPVALSATEAGHLPAPRTLPTAVTVAVGALKAQ